MKILMIIAQNGFRDEELDIPKKRFESAAIEVDVASESTDKAVGKFGMEISPDLSYNDVKVDDYDAIVMVGGPGAKELKEKQEIIDLVKEFYSKGKLTTAICIAPTILAKAGLLKGKKATVFESGKEEIEAAGAEYTGEDVTVDGKIITGNGPEAAKEFAEKVIDKLK